MKYKGVLFDLDGVILPSDKLHYLAWKKVCFHEHIFLYDLMFEETLGISKKEALRKILEHAKITLDESNQKRLIAEKDFYYEQYLKSIDENFVSVKVVRVLNKLQDAGVKMAIASSSRHAEELLEKTKMQKYFSVIVSGKDIKEPKPDPEVFLIASEKINLPKKDLLVVEDSLVGIESGINGGFDTCLFSQKANPMAKYSISSFDELLGIIGI